MSDTMSHSDEVSDARDQNLAREVHNIRKRLKGYVVNRDKHLGDRGAKDLMRAAELLSDKFPALSRRSASNTAGGGVKVKPLEWDRDTHAGWTEAKTSIGTYSAFADGTLILDGKQISYERGRAWHETEAAAQADFNARILSALEPIQAGGEPVATMHKSETETLFSKGWVPNLMGFVSTPLFTLPATPVSAEVTEALTRLREYGEAKNDGQHDGTLFRFADGRWFFLAALATLDRGRG